MTIPNQKSTQPKLRDKIFEQIEKKNITPKKPWVFVVREVIVWTCAVMAIVIGAIGFAAGLHSIVESDFLFYIQGPAPLFRFLSSSLPWVWIIVLLVMIFLTRFQIRHAKNGYRYRFLVLLIVLATIILGLTFHLLHAGRFIEQQLSRRAPGVAECFGPRHAPWERPEDGVLGGRVLRIESNGEVFIVRTPRQDDWTVAATGAEVKNKKDGIAVVEADQFVRMFGEETGELTFRANKIRVDNESKPEQSAPRPCGPPPRPRSPR